MRYVVEETGPTDIEWDYYVIDLDSENEPVGAFLDEETAGTFALLKNAQENPSVRAMLNQGVQSV